MRKVSFILILVLAALQVVYAQRPSERRKQSLQTQADVNDDPYFEVKDVPEAHKKESAVVLAQHTGYAFNTEKSMLVVTETNRKKIKLLDKAAVKEFSEFYYHSAPGYEIALSIEKPNGQKIEISGKDAVKVTTAVPEIYRTSYKSDTWEYYKVAVPNLEPGDILDYYTKVTESKTNYGTAQCFSPVRYHLNTNYTVLKQKIDFKVEKGFYVNARSLNGAPALVESAEASTDRRTTTYTVTDGIRPKVTSTLWVYQGLELPNIKFQVCFNQIGKEDKTYFFLGKPNEIKQSVKPEEIVDRVNYRYEYPPYLHTFIYNTHAFMKDNHKQVTDPEEYAKKAFYHLRNVLLVNPTSPELKEVGSIRDDIFAIMLARVLDYKKIKYDLLVSVPRGYGTLNDIAIYDELTWFLKVGNTYIYNPDRYSVFGEPDFTLQNTKALQITLDTNEKKRGYKEVTIPVTAHQDNSLQAKLDVKLSNTMDNMEINANYTATGLYKQNYIGSALAYLNLNETDYLAFGGQKPEEEKTRNKVKLAEYERKKQVEKEEAEKNTKEAMKELLEEEFKNVVAYNSFKLEKDGRSDAQKELVFSESYVLGDLVKKAGPNYIVELGTLLGSQVEILEEDKERKYDVNIAFAKSIKRQIVLTIPAGYQLEGISELNFNVDNAAGSFISKARLEGDKLIVDTEKNYKKIHVKKEDWNQMIAFLDAAYNFTQKKVILKRAI